jgi:tetratricopeptide (TPR) repeat protein
MHDSDGAQVAYQKAIGSSHWWAAPAAAVNLGNLHNAQGETADAERAYQQAIDSDLDLDQIKASLKKKLDEQGTPAVVEILDIRRYRPDPEARAIAALKLGQLQAARQDLQAARESFLRAARIGPAEIAALALFSLGNILRDSKDYRGAEEAYNRAVESGNPDIAPKAAVNLGSMLVMRGDLDGARIAFQGAADSGDPEAAGAAALSLGALLAETGNIEGARNAYERAMACPIGEVAEAAQRRLAALS